jgi:RNA:NAD 2'-phosphotransferase (TPT1/KptA family)
MDMDQRLHRLDDVGDMRIPDLLYHGTYREHVPSIFQHGLFAGGLLGNRTHVHLTERIDGMNEVAGVRGDADTIIVVDGAGVRNDPTTTKHLSKNNVHLTPRVFKKHILRAMDRSTGNLVSIPEQDEQGNIVGAQKVMEVTETSSRVPERA